MLWANATAPAPTLLLVTGSLKPSSRENDQINLSVEGTLNALPDALDLIRHRVIDATARPAGSGRTRKVPRLIAGLVLEAMGPVADDMLQALDEHRHLITQRADAVLGEAIVDDAQWIAPLGEAPAAASGRERWQLAADDHRVSRPIRRHDAEPAWLRPDATAQRIDHARTEAALTEIRRMNAAAKVVHSHREPSERTSEGRVL